MLTNFLKKQEFNEFLKKRFENEYPVSYVLSTSNDLKSGSTRFSITLTSTNREFRDVELAFNQFKIFTGSIRTEIFEGQSLDVVHEQAITMIEKHFSKYHRAIIACEIDRLGLLIHYFESTQNTIFHEVCTESDTIKKFCEKQFKNTNIPLLTGSDLESANEKSDYSRDIRAIEKESDTDRILIWVEKTTVRLFGLVKEVMIYAKKIEELNEKHQTQTIKLDLKPHQVTVSIADQDGFSFKLLRF